MFKLIAVRDEKYFAIQDTDDGVIDICTEPEIMQYLRVGLKIGGITPAFEQNTFRYSDEFFLAEPEDEDEDYDFEAEDDDEDSDFGSYEDEDEEEESGESESDESDYDADEDDEDEDVSSNVEEDDEDYNDLGGYDDEDDDDYFSPFEEEDTAVNKLYAILTTEQKDALKRFYLWSSQIMFHDAPTQGTFKVTNRRFQDKKIRLNQLKGQGSNWIYAGFIDLEFRGAGHCTFGHALRYEHFAWDASYAKIEEDFWGSDRSRINWDKLNALIDAGHVIKFGIECVGDFFEVPKETLDKIKKMQTRSIAEIEQLYDIYSNPEKLENAKASFGVFEALADRVVMEEVRNKISLGDKFVPSEDYHLFTFYSEFKKLGMVYPRMMVKRIQNVFLHRNTHEYRQARPLSNPVLVENLKRVTGIDTKKLQGMVAETYFGQYTMKLFRPYIENFFLIQTGGIYAYNPYSTNPRDRDEGMKNAESRAYFNRVTGTNDADAGDIVKIMETYYMYPMCFGQIRGNDFTMATGCSWNIEFTVQELGKLNKMYVLKDEIDELIDNSRKGVVCIDDYAAKNKGVLCYKEVDGYRWSDLWNEHFRGLRKTNTYMFIKDMNIHTFDDVIAFLEDRKSKIVTAISALKSTLSKNDEEVLKELEENCILSKCWDIRHLPVKEVYTAIQMGKEAYETAKRTGTLPSSNQQKVEAQEEQPKQSAPNVSSNPTTPKQIWEYCKAEVAKHGVAKAVVSDNHTIICVQYAIDNEPNAVAKLDAVNPIIRKIMTTLQTQAHPSDKQFYWVKKGFQKLMKAYDPFAVKPTRPVPTSSQTKPQSTSQSPVQTTPQQTVTPAPQQASKPVVSQSPVQKSATSRFDTAQSNPTAQTPQPEPITVSESKPAQEVKPAQESQPKTLHSKVVNVGERYKLSERPDIKKDVDVVTKNVSALQKIPYEDKMVLIKTMNALRAASSLGVVTKVQYELILDAKRRLGID